MACGLYLLVDGCVFSETAKFTLDGDAARVVGSGLDGVEGRAALRVGVVVVVVEVAGAMVEPSAGGIYEPCWIQGVHEISECEFGVFAIGDLAPACVVDDPGDDARIAAVLANEQFELALEFLLLFGVGKNGLDGAVIECATLGRSKRGHVLDEHQTKLVTGLVEQGSFYFDLIEWSVGMLAVDH